MAGFIAIGGIGVVLAALWLVNTFTDVLFRKGTDHVQDRRRASESERVRQRVLEQRREADRQR
jgi:hypothetical protein